MAICCEHDHPCDIEKKFGHTVREFQLKAIDAALHGCDVFLIQETGRGKSFVRDSLVDVLSTPECPNPIVISLGPLVYLKGPGCQ